MKHENTKNQQRIIDHRQGNILVSAGAGSGKTTVLTSHIIDRLNDKTNPIDIDRLLVVTFTKAAAAEMKERIAQKISDRRQKALLGHAHISTIDSFCSWIVKNNFEKIDIDPNFKLANEGELALIKRDVFDGIMEERYSSKDADFIRFVDSYTNGKSDDNIFTIIDTLYNKSMSQSDPVSYLKSLENMSITDGDVFELYPVKLYFDNLLKETVSMVSDFEEYAIYAVDKFAEVYEQNLSIILGIRACKDPIALLELLESPGRSIFKTKKEPYSDNDRIYFEYRQKINEYLLEVRKLLRGLNGFEKTYKNTIPSLSVLFDLTNEYFTKLQEEKRYRNIADFADVEHFALNILENNPDVSKRIRESFDEILIDEYQDSNELQEAIFAHITTGSNLFMVGDIKQSIYGFRNASPKLFSKRYDLYKSGCEGEAIDLTENFRCRQEVVNSVNEIFDAIMTRKTGGSDYKETSRLQRFATYTEPNNPQTYKSEFVTVKSNYGANYRLNAEADYIANRISEIIESKMMVFDKSLGVDRPVMYKDIAIIMRNIRTPNEVYASIFNEYNIPLISTKSTGYFDSAEVKLLLNALMIIDNPRQDIPLASVMLSPVGGFTNNELARLRLSYKPSKKAGAYNDLYDALINSSDNKVQEFLSRLKCYRALSKSHTILDLINIILRDTEYELYVKALKGGENRLANIDLLKEYAKEYEASSYSGIYDFCRYISGIKKREVNLEQANTLSNNENVVRMMTIHASKGLEYPIVFYTGLSGNINFDNKDDIAISSEYGVALSCKLADKSIKVKNYFKDIINSFNRTDIVSEEMRLMYVAMTRAREKLILVSSEGKDSKYKNLIDNYENGTIPGSIATKANSVHDIIMMAMPSDGFKHFDCTEIIPSKEIKTIYKIDYEDSIDREAFEMLASGIGDTVDFGHNYHNEGALGIKGSYSISELMSKTFDPTADPGEQVQRYKLYSYQSGGVELGSAYHKVFERINPTKAKDENYILEVINELVVNESIDIDISKKLQPQKIAAFYNNPIGDGVTKAYEQGKLYREKAFVLGIPASEYETGCKDDELTIVQGVIDLFYETDNGIILIDYKSNVINEGAEVKLVDKYRTQLLYYARAIEAETKKKVYKKYLYSISLGKFIEVE